MLTLNETLQQAGEETCIRFTWVWYAPFSAISVFLIKKADAKLLIPWQSNLLIWAIKTVSPTVMEIKILKHWQRLKVHRMPLQRYLGKQKIELLKRKVKSATGIQLKLLL